MPDTRLGIVAVLSDRGRVLLGRRPESEDADRRRWGMPGGELGFLETTQEAIARIVTAKTGLRVEPAGIAAIGEIIHPPLTHRVVLFFHATALSSALIPEDDGVELRWFELAELGRAAADGEIADFELDVLRAAGRLPPLPT